MSRRFALPIALACLLAAPSTALAAPDTSITSGPSGTTSSNEATFTFTSTEEGAFTCRLDSGAEVDCDSGVTYTGLADGQHTFRVWAHDMGGEPDPTPAVRTWTVDTTAPQTAFLSGPQSQVTLTYAQFRFGASESGSTFRCQLDGGASVGCESPFVVRELAPGPHTLRVWASDAAFNEDPSPAEYGWTVVGDAAPPPPPPADEEEPRRPSKVGQSVKLVGGKLRVRNRRVFVTVRCPVGQARCAGTVTVKAGSVRLGRARFRLTDGQRKTLRVGLSRKRLRRIRLIRRVKITAVTRDSVGNRATKRWTRALRI